MRKIFAIKIAIFFVAFFAFLVFFAPPIQAVDEECSPPFTGPLGGVNTCLECWQLGGNYCVTAGTPPPNYYCYTGTNIGNSCTVDNTTTSGTCDSQGNCIACNANMGNDCNINACGTAGGTVNCDGTCSGSTPAVPYTVGDYCTSPENACGSVNEGEITDECTGACSASTPAVPYTVGTACASSANNCDATNSGTITDACTGACSASAPANVPNLGDACNRNVCGGTGVLQCDSAGTGSECSAAAPTIPENYGDACSACNNVGECNSGTIGCDGNCSASAPADVTLTASLSANPTSGTTSTDFIMTATLGGTATGNVNLELLCNGTDNTAGPVNVGDVASYTFATPCEYNAAATYTPKIKAIRQTLSASGTTSITVTGPPDTTPPTISVSSVAGDATAPYWDKTNDSSTDIIVSGEANMLCRWDTSDLAYSAMTQIRDCPVVDTQATCSLGSLAQSSVSYTRYVACQDAAGNGQTNAQNLDVTFGVDWTAPAASYVSPTPLAGSDQSPPFTVYASGGDSGGSNLASCSFAVFDTSNNATRTQAFTCSGTSFTSQSFTVSATDCPTPGANTCLVMVYVFDNAGGVIAPQLLFNINPVLTYPSNTWQRLWYWTSGESPSFTTGNYKGEDLTQTAISFDKNYGIGVLPDGGQSYARGNNIGFKSSRTIDFTNAPGNYRFTVGSDDGIRLYIDDMATPRIDMWNDDNYRTQFIDVNMTAATHQFRIDYYENLDNARVFFGYAFSPCAKTGTIPTSNINVTVETATGTKQCPVQISHFGGDSDGSQVKYEVLSQTSSEVTIGMDDNPSSGCENNITWKTEWGDPAGAARNLRVHTRIGGYDTGQDLSYGYQILTDVPQRGCVIDSNVLQQSCDTTSFCLANISTPIASVPSWIISMAQAAQQCFTADYCPSHASLGDRYAVVRGNYGSAPGESRAIDWVYDYNVVECISNSQCDSSNADANLDKDYSNTAKCNLDPAITYAPQNTCIDSVAPTSKIKRVEEDTPGVLLHTFAPNLPSPGAYSAFLRADNGGDTKRTWWILGEDADNIGGSNLNTCHISINGVEKPTRNCNGWTSFTVGKDNPATPERETDCFTQGRDKCVIKVWATDKAGNTNATTERIIGDTGVPATTIDKDQRNYKDFILHPLGFNIFWFGVDWTPPTAQ